MPDDTLQRLQAFAKEDVGATGTIGLHWNPDREDWMFAAEWGSEAPDSPMVGAAAYGNDDDVTVCVEQALKDTRRRSTEAPTEVQPLGVQSGAERIAVERARQVDHWSAEHDDGHEAGELAAAAVSYALYADLPDSDTPPGMWPFERDHWRPTGDPITQLTKAGALIAAEIDRLLRAGAANAT